MVGLACLGLLLPPFLPEAAVAGQEADIQQGSQVPARDVALQDGGTLVGQVVDGQGNPLAGARVTVRQMDREVAVTAADAQGQFAVRGLRGGQYQIVAGGSAAAYRLWAPNTSPPAAQPRAILVAGPTQVRGQYGPIVGWLTKPWVLAGLVAAAIAIPIAIHESQVDRGREPASP